jgi:hypothetical protein
MISVAERCIEKAENYIERAERCNRDVLKAHCLSMAKYFIDEAKMIIRG